MELGKPPPIKTDWFVYGIDGHQVFVCVFDESVVYTCLGRSHWSNDGTSSNAVCPLSPWHKSHVTSGVKRKPVNIGYLHQVALIWPSRLTGRYNPIIYLSTSTKLPQAFIGHLALIWPSRLTGRYNPIIYLSTSTKLQQAFIRHLALIWPSRLTGR